MPSVHRIEPGPVEVSRADAGPPPARTHGDRDTTTPRRYLIAWLLSIGIHGTLLGILMFAQPLAHAPPQDPERLIYLVPAPPPPPLLASGGGGAPAVSQEQSAQKPVELAEARKSVSTVHPRPKPTVRPPRRQPVKQQPAPVEAVQTGEPTGEAEGVIGGVIGGKVGGSVGGHGDAPIKAELAASPPAVLSRVVPEYPSAARAQHVEGQVLLRAVVDRTGHVEESIVVVRSVALLDDAAVAALRQWHFTPGRDREGRTVRVQIEVPMRFQLR